MTGKKNLNPKQVPIANSGTATATSDKLLARNMKTIGDYLLKEELPAGTFGRCFLASHQLSGQSYCLRLLNRELPADHIQAGSLDGNRFIVPVIEFGRTREFSFQVSPFIKGENLESLIARVGRLETIHALLCVIRAIENLISIADDSAGHRHLRPSKLIVNSKGQIFIRDFTIAKLTERTPGEMQPKYLDSRLQLRHAIFRAPELNDRLVSATAQSDIYSLGCILHFLISGRPLFESLSYNDLARQHAEATPSPLGNICKDVPRDLERCVLKMVSKKPSARFTSYQHCLGTLKSILVGMQRTVESIDGAWPLPPQPTSPQSKTGMTSVAHKKFVNKTKLPRSYLIGIAVGIFALTTLAGSLLLSKGIRKDRERQVQTVTSEDTFRLP